MTVAQAHERCATWARGVGLDPAGTAPWCDAFVLVEHPLPWPDDLGSDPRLAELARVADEHVGEGRTARLQAVALDPGRTARRVVVFRRGEPPFVGYGRAEGVGSADDLPDLVASLLATEPRPTSARQVTDVLICTHGSRDACCGSMGTRLWMEAEQRLPGVRVWRTSHTGGHRFAPTAITFPDGSCWAHLDVEVLRGIVDRSVPAARATPHLRGCAAFGPALQVADRAVLAQRGWDWLECARFGEERGGNRVELCYESPTGERGGYDILLEEGRTMPVPDCGADPATAAKSQAELRVARLSHWT